MPLSRFRRLSGVGVVLTSLALDWCSGMVSDGFQTQKRGSWIPGKERAERVLASAISIDGRREWTCKFCSKSNEVALQALLSWHPARTTALNNLTLILKSCQIDHHHCFHENGSSGPQYPPGRSRALSPASRRSSLTSSRFFATIVWVMAFLTCGSCVCP